MTERSHPSHSGGLRQRWVSVRLVLAGGNALAAYQGGVYQALHERGLHPDLVAGTSMGAVNGALIAAAPIEQRLERLRAFWQSLVVSGTPSWAENSWAEPYERSAKRFAAMTTRLLGHPRLFAPTLPRFSEWFPAGRRGLYQMERLRGSLAREIDFTALAASSCKLVIHATDMATGDAVVFRSWESEIGPLQIQASSALPPDNDPVEIDGRLLGDGALSANLPIEFALSPLPRERTLCLAIDLFDPRTSRLQTLDDMYQRRLDLLLGNQARQAIELVRCRHALARARGESVAPLVVAHLRYPGSANEIGEKMFDYSAASVNGRWQAGYEQMVALLDRLQAVEASEDFTAVVAPSD